jgi:hypothetical protein
MRFTADEFDRLRQVGDPLADGVVAALMATGSVTAVNQVLREFHDNDQPIPDALPEVVRDYLKATETLPTFTDPVRLARVEDFFHDDGPYVGVTLALGSMLACYAHSRGARVLAATHRLRYPNRRFAETATFIARLMEPGALGGHGRFIPAAQKVRLIHAAVRYLLRAHGTWDEKRDGVPICQEDMLGAMLLFSVYVTDGLRRLGVHVTPTEEADYYHTWCVAGTILGISADILPATPEQGRYVLAMLMDRSIDATAEGISLAQHMIDYYQRLLPGTAFDGVIPALGAHVLGPEITKALRLPVTGWRGLIRFMIRFTQTLEKGEDTNAVSEKVLNRAGQLFLQAQFGLAMKGQCPHLDIPADLGPADQTTADQP